MTVNKRIIDSATHVYEGDLVDECSIESPIVLMELEEVPTSNYAYIPDFSRYYYITDMVVVRTGLIRVYMKVDVLKSFASDIKSSKALIELSDSMKSKYIPDGRTTFNAYNNYYVTKFGSGLSKTLKYILVVAGQN
jgi:hypothetical protein